MKVKKQTKKQKHVGVYGLVIKNNKVLLILKSRGPYKGKYDLPGGRLEKGETLEKALKREFLEEVGCEINNLVFLTENNYQCEYSNSSGDILDFFHLGTYYQVDLNEKCSIKKGPDGHDSLGTEFVSIQKIISKEIEIAPIVLPVILNRIKT